MRPIPQHSTDLLYKGDYQQEDLMALSHALGFPDIKYVTTATLTPERLLYHACLTGIQTYVKLSHTGERKRAEEIADLTDRLYESVKISFLQRIKETRSLLAEKERESVNFCQKIDSVESKKNWDLNRFKNTWNITDYSPRWQKMTIDAYQTIRSRVETGEYQLRSGENICDLVSRWSKINMQYKHYRDAARGLIENYIQQSFPPEHLLTMHPADKRQIIMFLGGMGSGKSEFSKYFIDRLPETARTDMVLHNADCLKYALYRSAKKEGILPKDHCYKGSEIQAESSNALYEATRKRGYLARQKFQAPNVVLNSVVLGSFEVLEGIASGGSTVAHHLLISPQDAAIEVQRRIAVDDRTLSEEDVKWSTDASAKSLLLLTEPAYKKTNVTVHLYQRHAGKAPVHYASIDAAHNMFYVHDLAALAELSSAMFDKLSQMQALRQLLTEYTNAGFTFALIKEASQTPIATLDAAKNLNIVQPIAFRTLGELSNTFVQAAASKCSSHVRLASIKPQGALYVGR